MTMRNTFTIFLRDARGGVALMFGLLAFIILLIGGGALDYGMAQSKRTSMQAAADAAALAAAKSPDATLAERQTTGAAIFKANFAEASGVNFELTAPGNNVVNVTTTYRRSNYFLALIGMPTWDITTVAEVPIANNGFAEVVLVLDYSDSMITNDKYIRMRDAAMSMINTISANGTNTNVKIGLVPFSAVVHADIPATYLRSDIAFDGCTMDRRYPYNIEDGAINAGDASKWGDHSVGGHLCVDVAAANLKVLPLTSNIAQVESTLQSYLPYLWTHIAAGAEFGWQVLSPTGVFGGARSYDEQQNLKVMILLTDGMQTAPGWGPSDSRTAADGEANLSSICTTMKAKGVQVYTIGYDLTDAHTLNLLNSCASSGGYFASTDISNGLATAFAAIATRISNEMLRLSR